MDDVRGQFACGPGLDDKLAAAQEYADAGFDHLVMQNVGPDQHGFLEWASEGLVDRVRGLAPASGA